jgi:hypothetical protein
VFNINRKHTDKIVAYDKKLPSIPEVLQIVLTFILVTIGWVFFRADSIATALDYLGSIPHKLFSSPGYLTNLAVVGIFIVLEWFSRKDERNPHAFVPNILYIVLLVLALLTFGKGGHENIEFIYFQF